MSKPVKELIQKELTAKIKDVKSMAVVAFTGIDAITNHQIRTRLLKKQIEVMVVKNSIARQVFKAGGIEQAGKMLSGPCALVWGADSVVTVVRELLDIAKDVKNLQVRAAMLDGDVFPTEKVEALSKFPTRGEAISLVAGQILGVGRKTAAYVLGPGKKVAALVKAIEEKSKGSEPAAA